MGPINTKHLEGVYMKSNLRFQTTTGLMFLLILLGLFTLSCSAEKSAGEIPEIPAKGKVTMVDIGANECIPCKMMAPIMEELESEYHHTGKAAIYFIDVWKNREQGRRFGIRSIPTQIFYDKDGNEVQRHEGFMQKKDIVATLRKLRVE